MIVSPPSRLRRSQGQVIVARSLWYIKPGACELRHERLGPLQPGQVRVQSFFSGISRGTERLVANGEVPESEWSRMRAPLQAGNFPFPVKYGYSATGRVTAGPDHLIDKPVFCLAPHQDHIQVAEDLVIPVPEAIPLRRAILAANMETALNAHWDAGTGPGDTVAIVGGGITGLLVGALASRIAGTTVSIADIDPACAGPAQALGLKFVRPADLRPDHNLVFHATASSAGLETALEAAAFEGRIIELSWYGTKPVAVHLGSAFHSRRLSLVSSQVGHVAPSRRSTITPRDRLAKAISLLDDPRLDVLVAEDIAFELLPDTLYQRLTATSGLPPVISFSTG